VTLTCHREESLGVFLSIEERKIVQPKDNMGTILRLIGAFGNTPLAVPMAPEFHRFVHFAKGTIVQRRKPFLL
jgi:hypothetical protein